MATDKTVKPREGRQNLIFGTVGVYSQVFQSASTGRRFNSSSAEMRSVSS